MENNEVDPHSVSRTNVRLNSLRIYLWRISVRFYYKFMINFRQYSLNISSIVSNLFSLNSGSVCALYLALHIIRMALFWSLLSLLSWYPQAVVQNWKWLLINELYINFRAEWGRKCFNLSIIPTTRDILLDIFLIWEHYVICSLIVNPKKLNSWTRSISDSLIFNLGISPSLNFLCR